MRNKILYIGGFRLPDQNAAAHRVLSVGRILDSIGYTVEYLGIADKTERCIQAGLPIGAFSTYIQKYPQSGREWMKYATDIQNILHVLDKSNDWFAVIAYNYPAIALAKLKKALHKRQILLLSDCTEWYPLRSLSMHSLLSCLDSELRMRLVQKKIDGIITISSFLQKYYRKQTTVLIPPLVDLEDPKWKAREYFNREDKTGCRIVYAGSTDVKKDRLDVIVRLMEKCSVDIKAEIIGVDQSTFLQWYPKMEKQIDLLQKNGQLTFRGWISHNEAIVSICSADWTVFFREKNRVNMAGFPTKFVESITCGTPVITTGTSDLPAYIHDGENGILISATDFERGVSDIINRIDPKTITVDCSLFDYHRYCNTLENWLKSLRRDKWLH